MDFKEISQEEVSRLEREVYEVVVSKIEEKSLPYSVQIIIYEDVFTTGVQGDDRTYCPLVEVTLLKNGKVAYDKNLAHELGTEIPNKVRNTNRVVVTIPTN